LALIEAKARKEGHDRLKLDCGSEVAGSIAYYERRGFIEAGRRMAMGFEAVLLEKRPLGGRKPPPNAD
jgi:hypothetical protein